MWKMSERERGKFKHKALICHIYAFIAQIIILLRLSADTYRVYHGRKKIRTEQCHLTHLNRMTATHWHLGLKRNTAKLTRTFKWWCKKISNSPLVEWEADRVITLYRCRCPLDRTMIPTSYKRVLKWHTKISALVRQAPKRMVNLHFYLEIIAKINQREKTNIFSLSDRFNARNVKRVSFISHRPITESLARLSRTS